MTGRLNEHWLRGRLVDGAISGLIPRTYVAAVSDAAADSEEDWQDVGTCNLMTL